MKKISLLVSIVNFCIQSIAQNPSNIQNKLSSNSYNLKFSIYRTILSASKKNQTDTINGLIYRNKNHIYSETDFIKGIYEDTLGIFIDSYLEMATLFSDIKHTVYLVNPFYDPSAIMNYAKKWGNSTKITTNNGDNVYDISFSIDSTPAKKLRVIENNEKNHLTIEFTYQRLNEVVNDIITYMILPDSIYLNIPKISDYVDYKNGKYVKKAIITNYDFLNTIPLESLFQTDF